MSFPLFIWLVFFGKNTRYKIASRNFNFHVDHCYFAQ